MYRRRRFSLLIGGQRSRRATWSRLANSASQRAPVGLRGDREPTNSPQLLRVLTIRQPAAAILPKIVVLYGNNISDLRRIRNGIECLFSNQHRGVCHQFFVQSRSNYAPQETFRIVRRPGLNDSRVLGIGYWVFRCSEFCFPFSISSSSFSPTMYNNLRPVYKFTASSASKRASQSPVAALRHDARAPGPRLLPTHSHSFPNRSAVRRRLIARSSSPTKSSWTDKLCQALSIAAPRTRSRYSRDRALIRGGLSVYPAS